MNFVNAANGGRPLNWGQFKIKYIPLFLYIIRVRVFFNTLLWVKGG
jgi:hypothetical protein